MKRNNISVSAVLVQWSLFVILAGGVASGTAGWAESAQHVIVISIDGMSPRIYLPGPAAKICPTLASLRKGGSYARKALPPYPSMTYPGHASIVTGVSPAQHGIYANNMFDAFTGVGRGFWYASDLKSPVVWDAVHDAGLSVAAVSWPTTAGSKSITWNIPEFWTFKSRSELTAVRRYVSAGLLDEIEESAGRITKDTVNREDQWDQFVAISAAQILMRYRPNLLLVHFQQVDKAQHMHGPDSPRVPEVLQRIDGLIAHLLKTTEDMGVLDRTAFIILGDHGFVKVEQSIAPNKLLARNGFINLENRQVKGWKAMIQNTGCSAALYVRNPGDEKSTQSAIDLLQQYATNESGERIYRIIDPVRLRELGAPAKASAYLEASAGFMFSGSCANGPMVQRSFLKGNHGSLPDTPNMETGLLAFGYGIRKGIVLDQVYLVDVAPTVAALLGVRFDRTEGRVLREMLKSSVLEAAALTGPAMARAR